MVIDPQLAARLPGLHEAQEQQEAANVIAEGVGAETGVDTRTWGRGLWSVRTRDLPHHGPGNQLTGLTALDEVDLDAIDAVVPWFDAGGCSMRIRLPASWLDLEVGRELAARGFVFEEVEAWMAAPIDALRIDAPPHDIRPVRDASDAADFATAFTGGWGITAPRTRRVAVAALGAMPGPPSWRRYVARVDGEPAGEAILGLYDDVGYLAEAATVPRFRRRGIQRALIARRIVDARDAGCTTLFGAVQYGDQSWANMASLGLREATLTVSFRRAPRS